MGDGTERLHLRVIYRAPPGEGGYCDDTWEWIRCSWRRVHSDDCLHVERKAGGNNRSYRKSWILTRKTRRVRGRRPATPNTPNLPWRRSSSGLGRTWVIEWTS